MSNKIASYVIAALAVVAIGITIRLFRRERISHRNMLLWTPLWLAMGFFALFPAGLDYIRNWLSMGDRMIFLFVTSNVILFLLVFRLYSALEETKQKLRKVAQEIALEQERTQSDLPENR